MSIRQRLQWCRRCWRGVRHPRHRSVSAHAARSAGTLTRVLDKPSLFVLAEAARPIGVPSAAPGPHTTSPRVHRRQRGNRVLKDSPVSFTGEENGCGRTVEAEAASFERHKLSGSRSFRETGWLLSLREPLGPSGAAPRGKKAVDSESPLFLPLGATATGADSDVQRMSIGMRAQEQFNLEPSRTRQTFRGRIS